MKNQMSAGQLVTRRRTRTRQVVGWAWVWMRALTWIFCIKERVPRFRERRYSYVQIMAQNRRATGLPPCYNPRLFLSLTSILFFIIAAWPITLLNDASLSLLKIHDDYAIADEDSPPQDSAPRLLLRTAASHRTPKVFCSVYSKVCSSMHHDDYSNKKPSLRQDCFNVFLFLLSAR